MVKLIQERMDATPSDRARAELLARFNAIRTTSVQLCEPLQTEDYVIQSMDDVSPPKWHLAHTTWFFETFALADFAPGYRPFHPAYKSLFNSYYNAVGEMWPRNRRGQLSRPTVAEVFAYRRDVDRSVGRLISTADDGTWPQLASRIEVGLHHEQQHQELLLMDIKHILWCNPLKPAYQSDSGLPLADAPDVELQRPELQWLEVGGGLCEFGHSGDGFCFDNEEPRHRAYVRDLRLANRCVTNQEFLEFVNDAGYETPALWLAEGWTAVNQQQWRAPLYWQRIDGTWHEFTLRGLQPLELAAPVVHLSYYEADSFARWAGRRLPTEYEWELAARHQPVAGNFVESGRLHPAPSPGGPGLHQLFGDVWEWTQSPYGPYPGYSPAAGALGEYNGKFMCGQFVLRGGSCATSQSHVRLTYRNFFYPQQRWAFQGVRLADDV
jgi:ergothioneine biosynthesis protein EgtB